MQKLRERLHWYILGFLFIATFLVWYAVVAEDRAGKLTVAFLNIGQGDAIFVESPTGVQMMIDGGGGPIVLRELGKVMPFYDRTIDMLMVSNPDKDHMAGFLDVLDAYNVTSVIEPGTMGASAEYKTLEEKIEKEKAVKVTALRGQKIDLGGGAYFEVLFPDRDVPGLATNDGSLVGRLVYGDTSIMFTGDAPQNIEGYLDSLDGKSLHSDILKVGHHGSRTSTSQEFVGYVSPTYAVISAGKDNSYGHPNKETLDTLNQFGVQTLRTDLLGTIVMESDGETIRVRK